MHTVSPIPIDTDAVAEGEGQGTSVDHPEMLELLRSTGGTITERVAAIVAAELMDPRAARIGCGDGSAASAEVRSLLA